MIWVAWRRHRLMLLILAALLVALSVWMALVAHSYDVASNLQRTNRCSNPYGNNNSACFGYLAQAQIIIVVLLALPCLIGLVIGAPLVAGELHSHTNRLAWTQSISRTRWFVTKWLLGVVGLIALSSLFQLVVSRWFGHVHVASIGVLSYSQGFGADHIRPTLFNITGVVPIGYVLFAFSLGVALGAVIRRTPWAIAATVVAYGAAAMVMVVAVRPNLMPQTFVAFQTQITAPLSSGPAASNRAPWNLGSGYRYVPGYKVPASAPSANAAGQTCQLLADAPTPTRYNRCITDHHLQDGVFYQAADHYWPLQWRESAIYFGASIILFAIGLWSVRRWRA
jgi:ABC-type transport system involved in multi-copper enzyme maturation permease subunit